MTAPRVPHNRPGNPFIGLLILTIAVVLAWICCAGTIALAAWFISMIT